MTIDEAIANEREKAKEHKNKAEYQLNRGIEAPQINLHIQSEVEQAEHHEHLAEWLEELSKRRAEELFRKTDEKSIRNKAIDEFVQEVKTAVTEMDDIGAYDNPTKRICEILEIEAERLKSGGDNEETD